MWNVAVVCLRKIKYPWVQVYLKHQNQMKSGMRVLFPIRLNVTCAAKYIDGNRMQCMMLLKCSLCCPVTGLQVPAGTTRFSLAQSTQTSCGAQSVSCAEVPKGSFTRVKWPACEADHSYLVSWVEWSYTFTLHICLHGARKDLMHFICINPASLLVYLVRQTCWDRHG